ncbi:MAG: hypothetical protein GQ574_25640 [Crocinitomix sp.]|nr:hypothetical protein [Crocinitomix sp.]
MIFEKGINNVVMFDGVKEYSTEEIINTPSLRQLLHSVLVFGGFPTIIDSINKEEGMLYIKTDTEHKFGTPTLRDVSSELYSEYLKVKP